MVGPDLPIEFESDSISLEGVILEDEWRIFPLIPPTVRKVKLCSFLGRTMIKLTVFTDH